MGFKKFFKKVGKAVKKVLPYAGLALPFIPGVGAAAAGVISKVGSALGGSSAQSNAGFVGPPDPANPSEGQSVSVDGRAPPGWLASNAPALIQGGLGYLGQQQANTANAQQAERQMAFQADQTSSSYQRATADMKAAGLNPMLAYSQGGAASGGGASAQMGSELGAGANSAQSAMMARQQMAQSAATIENIQADTHNKETQTENISADTLHKYALTSSEGTRNHELTQKVSEIALRNQLAAATQQHHISSAKFGARYDESKSSGEDYSLAEKAAWSRFYRSWVGKQYPFVAKGTEQSNSAANVFRKFIPFTND